MTEPTDDMARAYLAANKAYWHEVDSGPKRPGVWRNGTPHEATMVGLRAALAAVPASPTAATALTELLGVLTEIVGAVPDVSVLGVEPDRIRVAMVKATAALTQQPADKPDAGRHAREAAAAIAKPCEWTNCPTRVGNVCCNDRTA